MRRLICASVVVVLGCTEPNPNAAAETGSEAGSGDPTSAGTTPGTSMTSSPETTVNGTEDPETTIGTTVDPSDTSGDTTEPTTGEPTCAGNCVALPPGDWEGPVAVLHDAPDDPEPECEGVFDTFATTAFANLDAPAASCECDCEDPEGAACSQVTVVSSFEADCSPADMSWSFGTSCNSAVNDTDMYWRATAAITSGSCDAVDIFEVPDAGFGDRYSACVQSRVDTTGCEAGTACIETPAAPFDGRVCIWHSGDLQCPADAGFDNRIVYYGNFADDRGCEACECGDAEGECSGSVALWSVDGCPGGDPISGALSVGGACLHLNDDLISSADVSGAGLTPTASASCPPSDSQAVGEAEGVDPVTFCCDA